MLELAGNGMVGVPGTAERLFAALHGAGVSVTMISQGSSEHSICCIVRADQAERGRAAIAAAFADAMADQRTQAVHVTTDICVLAAVGDGMVGTPGVAARLLGGLAQARVNVRAIAQGASERNISVAIAERRCHARAARRAFGVLAVAAIPLGRHHRTRPGRPRVAVATDRDACRGCARNRGSTCACARISDSQRMVLAETGLDPAVRSDRCREPPRNPPTSTPSPRTSAPNTCRMR